MKKYSAFTLIELLIVVAIIAILAAIAVPNFLEAQIRSKISRAQSDMRSIATALESYRVDQNSYPLACIVKGGTWDTNRCVINAAMPNTNANWKALSKFGDWYLSGFSDNLKSTIRSVLSQGLRRLRPRWLTFPVTRKTLLV